MAAVLQEGSGFRDGFASAAFEHLEKETRYLDKVQRGVLDEDAGCMVIFHGSACGLKVRINQKSFMINTVQRRNRINLPFLPTTGGERRKNAGC